MNTLQRRKEKREPDPNGGGPTAVGGAPAAAEEAQRPRSMTVSAANRVTFLFSTAGWTPLDPAGGRLLASNVEGSLSPVAPLRALKWLEGP